MLQDDAKRAICAEFRPRAAQKNIENATGAHGLMFFGFLQQKRQQLISFKASGDKWQVVHGWLLRARLVSD